jgi:hypothetical protein
MSGKTGVMSISDLLKVRFISIIQFSLDRINTALQNDVEVHNTLATTMIASLAEITSDRMRSAGSSDAGQMEEVDEFGRSKTQKPQVGATVGFPMRLFQYAVGWNRKFFETKTPADMAALYLAAKKAHRKKIQALIKRAFYLSTNFTYRDHLVDKVDIAVKRFWNADSMPIPEGPNGEVYNAATHTHYMANAGLTAAFATSVVRTVVEHGLGGSVKLVINQADEVAFRALTGFQAYPDPRIALGTQINQIANPKLNITRLDNRAIGIFDAAEVWVKPWGIASYLFAYDETADPKPLVMRTRDGSGFNLHVAAELDTYPLHAQYMEDEFDFAVQNRSNGAVGYFGGGAYVDPTILG